MILPKDIKSRNAIRDSQIINLYMDSGLSQTVLANKFSISQNRVSTILRRYASVIITNIKDYDKIKRLHWLNKSMQDKLPTARTKLELVEARRKELEGENVVNVVAQFLQIEPANTPSRIISVSPVSDEDSDSRPDSEPIKHLENGTGHNEI